MHTELSALIYQKPEYVKYVCFDRNNCFQFACRARVLYNQTN